MSNGSFIISNENPNDTHGGGGCLCSEMQPATRGPKYVVFEGCDTDSPISPRSVICTQCVDLIQQRLDAKVSDEKTKSVAKKVDLELPETAVSEDTVEGL